MLPETAARPVSIMILAFLTTSLWGPRQTLARPHCEGRVRPHIRVGRVFEFYTLSSRGNPSFSTRRDITLPTLRSRSPCASWAPPLHRGLVRGSFPAPHHHDPNGMLPNFQIWVMVVCLSNGSSRSHRALEGSSLPSCSFLFVILLRLATPALRLGVFGSLRPSVSYCSTSLRTQARPAIEFVSGKEGLRPRIAVFGSWYCSLRVQVFLEFVYWDTLNFGSAPGLSGGRGEMAMAVASSARLAFLRGAVCACCMPYTRCFPFWSLYSDGPMSSRPQPLGRGGDVAPCEDTREDFGLWFKYVAGCLLMVPHALCSPAAGTTFQLLPVGREGCRVVHDMCKGFNGRRSKPNGPEPAKRWDRWGE